MTSDQLAQANAAANAAAPGRPPVRHPATHSLKLAIAQQLMLQRKKLNLNVRTFGTLVGLCGPDVSRIMHGKVDSFTLEFLCRALHRAGLQADFVFTPINLATTQVSHANATRNATDN